MRMKLCVPFLGALMLAVLSACSSKMGELSSDYFTVTPQVLEADAGKVPATINGKFPEKYFNKKAIVEVTPVLRWDGGEARGEATTFQGEKVQGNDQTISYKMGGNYTLRTSFDYVPEMAKSELYLEFKATVGKKTVEIPAVKVADGVISTSEMVEQTLESATPATGNDAFQRVIKEKRDANIMFLIQQANIRASELKNAKNFTAEAKDINESVNKKITDIEISAYASPDGGLDLNTGLAEKRRDNTEKALGRELKKADITAPVDAQYTAEDWEGFQELVSKSDIQDKELILRVLSMYSDPEQREQEIKNISAVYKTLAEEILPQLRRSRLTLNYEIIGKSDEEISKLAKENASELNLEELLYAATLTNDQNEKMNIYQSAVKLYPEDCRAYNNIGKIYYQHGNIDKAESYYKQSLQHKESPEANMNLGLISLKKGDVAAAETYLGKAAGAEGLNEAMGNLYIAQGKYDQAVASFGETKTNSAALAQILAKNYNKARTTLDGIQTPDAYTDYLKAVLAARTNNPSAVTASLKKAVSANPSLAKKAAVDLEFAKYFTNADFMSIVQ